ncbi:MAG: SiaB family protein kinase [gamma proteobacterium symbiont of Taylorina sp.]|nr:SiaB family protein kinase [gamma proteobacterium symbiont of Taylorina sp.]
MKAEKMLRLRDDLQEDGILICYSGYMTESVLSSLGKTIKDKLTIEKTDKFVIRGVFSIFVEQMQNVIRYSDEMEVKVSDDSVLELRYGVLTVGRKVVDGKEDVFFVAIGNMIKQHDVERLNNSLTHIQQLDAKSLKALHKEILKGKTPEGSKGAGVGFIDIARISKNGFDFDFIPVNNDQSFFTLTAYA